MRGQLVSVCNRFDSSDNFLVVAHQLQQPEYYTYNKQLILFSSGGGKKHKGTELSASEPLLSSHQTGVLQATTKLLKRPNENRHIQN